MLMNLNTLAMLSVMMKEMIKTYYVRFVVYSHELIMVWCYGSILQLVLLIGFDTVTESA